MEHYGKPSGKLRSSVFVFVDKAQMIDLHVWDTLIIQILSSIHNEIFPYRFISFHVRLADNVIRIVGVIVP